MSRTPKKQATTLKRALVVAGIALAAVAGAVLVPEAPDSPTPPGSSRDADPTPDDRERRVGLVARLQESITLEGVMQHLQTFQAIADDHDGNRFTATQGHEASVDYVSEVLTEAGYEVSFDELDVTVYEQDTPSVLRTTAPSRTTFERSADFTTFNFSPSGDVTGAIAPVGVERNGLGAPDGCEEDAFAGFPTGNVALVQAGPCPLTQQVLSAQEAGASAVLLMFTPELADTSSGVLRPTLASSNGKVPALAVSNKLGRALARPGTRVRVEVDGSVVERRTRNVIAERPNGPADVVMVGAHLDSVQDGPGINDNGSGSAAILELAVAMADVETSEGVRFAFWTAEELGLLGSEHYVDELNDSQRVRITAYLNFDMVASPNYLRLVYGDNLGNIDNPAAIKNLFLDYFERRDLATDVIDLSGRSDHGPFERAGIPVGGLFTGAEMIKSDEAEGLFGGEADAPADPCYHLACDDLANLSRQSLNQLTDAIAYAVATLATSDDI
ncbi:MAG: M28 family peptidase [Actinomycetota bacterium]